MRDLIDRQAAIDALMKRDKELRNINWYDKPFAECECKGIDYALEIVNALPSVQPTQPNASNALKTLDCIDRQAAIDVALPYCPDDDGTCSKSGDDLRNLLDDIENLPSAQPETCEGCKHLGKWENEVEYGYPSPCTRCKRRVRDNYER